MNFYTQDRIKIHFQFLGKQNPFQKLEGVSPTTNIKGTRKEKQCNVNFCKNGSAPSIPCGKAFLPSEAVRGVFGLLIYIARGALCLDLIGLTAVLATYCRTHLRRVTSYRALYCVFIISEFLGSVKTFFNFFYTAKVIVSTPSQVLSIMVEM